jgi:hypothetical protein
MIEKIKADDIVIPLPEGTTQASAEDGNKERDDRASGWNLLGTFIFPETGLENPVDVWEKLRNRNFLPKVPTKTKKGEFQVCHIQVKNTTTNEFVCIPLWWLARADVIGLSRTPLETALKECKTDKERVALLQGRAIRTSDEQVHVLDRSRWYKLNEVVETEKTEKVEKAE